MPTQVKVSFPKEPFDTPLGELVAGEDDRVRVELSEPPTTPISFVIHSQGFTVPDITVNVPAGQPSLIVSAPITFVQNAKEYKLRLRSGNNCSVGGGFFKADPTFELVIAAAFAPQPLEKRLDQLVSGETLKLKLELSGKASKNVEVTIECDGFTQKTQKVTIPAGKTKHEFDVTLVADPGEYECKISNVKNAKAKGFLNEKQCKHLKGKTEFGFKVGTRYAFSDPPFDKPLDTLRPGDRVTVNFDCTGTVPNNASFTVQSTGFRGGKITVNPPSAPHVKHSHPGVTLPLEAGTYTAKIVDPITNCKAEGEIEFKIPLLVSFPTKPMGAKAEFYPGDRASVTVQLSASPKEKCKVQLSSPGFREPVEVVFAPKTVQLRQTVNVTLINKTGLYAVHIDFSSLGDIDPKANSFGYKIAARMTGLTPAFSFVSKDPVQPVKAKYDVDEEIGFLIESVELPEKPGSLVLRSDAFDQDIPVPFHASQRELRVDARISASLFGPTDNQDKVVEVTLVDVENCNVRGKLAKLTVQPPVRVQFDSPATRPDAKEGYYPGDKIRIRVKADRPAAGNGIRIGIKSDAFVHSELCPDGEHFIFMAPGKQVAFTDAYLFCGAGGLDNGGDAKIEITDNCEGCFPALGGLLTAAFKIRPLPLVGFASLVWIEPMKVPYYQGELITLHLILSSPAPATGAKTILSSPALAGDCLVEFLPGETKRACKVRLQNAPDPTGPDTVEFILLDPDTPVGCRLSPTPEDIVCRIDVAPGPKVNFKSVWISPTQPDYLKGERVTIYGELDGPAVVDTLVRVDSDAFGGAAYFIHFPAGSTTSGAKTDQKKSKDVPGVILKTGQDILNSNNPAVRILVASGSMAMGGGTSLLKSAKLPGPIEGAQATLRGNKDIVVSPGASHEVYDVTLTPVVGCVAGTNVAQTVKIRRTVVPPSTNSWLPCRPQKPEPVPPLKYCNIQRLLITEIRGAKKPATAKRGHDGNGTFEVVGGEGAPKKTHDAFISDGKIEVIAGKVIYELDDDIHNCTIAIRADVSDDRCDLDFPHVENEDRKHPHLIVLQEFTDRLENVIGSGLNVYKAKQTIDQMEKSAKASRDYPGWVVYQAKSAKKLQKDVRGNAEKGVVLWKFKAKKRAQKYEKLLAKASPLKEVDTGFGLIPVTQIIKSVQYFVAPRLERYRILLQSCGLPDPSKKGQVPTPELKLDIDVYPSEEFCLYINFTPLPAAQFGNNGQYYADPSMSPNNVGTSPDDPNRAANNTNLTDQSGLPSQITPGSTSPLLNQEATESTTPNSTAITQQTPHGGGTVLSLPPSALSEDETRDQIMSRKQGGSLIYTEDLQFLKTGKSFENVIAPSSKEQRVLPQHPSTRVFHPIYSEGAFNMPPDTPPAEEHVWSSLKAGLVCNGRPKPEFMKIGQAIMAILYVIRHIGDFFEGMQDMVPSWGWGVTVDIGFLEGAFRLRWGWKEYEDWRVFRWACAQAEILLFRVGIEVWAGFKARALFVRFQFVAFGKISGALPLKLTVERKGPDGGALFTASLGAATTAEIGIRIVIIHENACYAKASIRTGFLFNFRLPDPGEEGPIAIFWEAYFLGLSIGIDFKIVGFKKVFQKEKVLIEGNPPGVPFRQGVLFPRGDDHSAWRARRQLRHVWLRASAKFSQLDEALSWWHDLQFVLLNKRDPEEFEADAELNPDYEWPWTDDPNVKVTAFGKGHAIKTTEDSHWVEQWAVFKKALSERKVLADGDKSGKGKVVKYAKYKSRVPKIGDKLAGDVNLVEALTKAINRCEVTIEKVKQTIMLIDHKYISTLRAIDKELTEADEYERPVAKEYQKALDDAQSWGDPFGDITKLVEEALKDSKLARLEYYVENTDSWTVGQKIVKP